MKKQKKRIRSHKARTNSKNKERQDMHFSVIVGKYSKGKKNNEKEK